MTKIPIFLSILSLAGGVGATPLAVNNGLAQDKSMQTAKTRDSVEEPSIVANQNVAGLNFTQLNLAIGQLDWEFQYQDSEGRTFSRYVMATPNFMKGVTEAEADQKLAMLGITDWNDWTNWQDEFAARDGRYGPGTNLSAAIAWSDPLHLNRPDLIYYAIEYKNWNDPSVEAVWYRGKLDYRGCAHAPDIESNYAMTCQISLDKNTNRYSFTPNSGTLSYEDEMKEIARESYLDSVRQQIEGLEDRKARGDESYRAEIDSAELALNNAKRHIDDMHLTEALADEVSDLENRIAKLRQEDTTPPSGDKDNENNDPNPGDGEEDEPATNNPQAGANISQSSQGDGENSAAPNPVASDAVPVADSDSNNTVALFNSSAEADQNNQTSESSGGIDDYSGAKSDIEVPDLGADSPWLKRHLWVLLLPVGLVGLVIFILVKRRREDEEDEI